MKTHRTIFITVRQLALILKCSAGTIYNWKSNGQAATKLPPYIQHAHGTILFPRQGILDFLHEKTINGDVVYDADQLNAICEHQSATNPIESDSQ